MQEEAEGPLEAYEMEVPTADPATQPFVPPTSGSQHERPITSVGDLYVALGNPGKMAMVIFIAVSFNYFSVTSNHLIGVFFVHMPEHECRPDFGWNTTATEPDLNHHSPDSNHSTHFGNSAHYTNHQSISVNHYACHVTINNASDSSNMTRNCKPGEWHYQLSTGETTTVTEWDLVCEYSYLGNLANTLYYLGVTISGFSIAFISDTIGRKVAILLCLYSLAFIGLGITFCTSFVLFVCLRTLMGLAAQALMTTSYIQIVEMFPPAHRGKAGAGIQTMWGLSMVYLSLAAWGLQNWRYIQLASTVPAMISAIYLLFMPESLRWLLSRGKVDRASKVIKRIYRFNGATDKRCLDHQLLTTLASSRKEEQGTFIDLCRSPTLRRNTIIFALVACAINLGYWGIAYNSSKVLGNRYLNFLLGAVAELIVLTMNIYVVNRFGRKKSLMFYFFLGCICCVTLSFLRGESNMVASMTVATLGRLAMSGLFSAGDLYAAELFPTVIRTTGVSVYVMAGRLGGIITPQIFTLGDFTFQELPLLIFGCTSLAGLLLTLLLPDTSEMELADTVMEAEAKVATLDKGLYDREATYPSTHNMEDKRMLTKSPSSEMSQHHKEKNSC